MILEKRVGQTPLACLEAYRATQPALAQIPMAYAGRLDPMASGKLLVLQGAACKRQDRYFALDKAYHFKVLLGVSTDTGDVLGLPTATSSGTNFDLTAVAQVCRQLRGQVELPYPHYSSKPVHGKPLHTWAVEGRLDEIEIPTKHSRIYKLYPTAITTYSATTIYEYITDKIETIPPVTDPRKALGNDFRRPEIRTAWRNWHTQVCDATYSVVDLTCVCSSGTYMRTLANVIGEALGTHGLAWSIHRSQIGRYQPLPFNLGFWSQQF